MLQTWTNFSSTQKRNVLLGGLAVASIGVMGYIFFSYLKKNAKVEKLPLKNGKLNKKDLLYTIRNIKQKCNPVLKSLRDRYRRERRGVFNDEKAYLQMIEDYNTKILHILEDNSQQIFQKHGINDKIFDDSVREYLEDDEVSSAIHSLATVEENTQAPNNMTRERLLEIFNYNNKRVKQGYIESDQNYEYLTARVQDEIFFKYNIEMEELAACYKKWDCENDPDFQVEVSEMKESISKFLSPVRLSPRS